MLFVSGKLLTGTPERGARGASASPALFQEGQEGKSALLMEQYISLATFNSIS